MVGLVLATAIAALREKSTRAKAIKNMASQAPAPLSADSEGFDDAAGFDENAEFGTDGVDAFGTDQGEFEAFDENAFK